MLNSHRLSLTKIHLKVCFPLNYHYMGMVGFSKMLWHSHRKNKYFPLYRANFLGKDFPGGSDGKEFTCQCRRYWRLGFDPWVRKISWRRKWQPNLNSCLGNPRDRRAWWATVHGVAKSPTQLKHPSMHAQHYVTK